MKCKHAHEARWSITPCVIWTDLPLQFSASIHAWPNFTHQYCSKFLCSMLAANSCTRDNHVRTQCSHAGYKHNRNRVENNLTHKSIYLLLTSNNCTETEWKIFMLKTENSMLTTEIHCWRCRRHGDFPRNEQVKWNRGRKLTRQHAIDKSGFHGGIWAVTSMRWVSCIGNLDYVVFRWNIVTSG